MFLKKKVRIKDSIFCTTEIAYFGFAQEMIIFPGGVSKMEFPEGRGVHFVSRFWKIQTEGWHRKNSFRGGLWIFSG